MGSEHEAPTRPGEAVAEWGRHVLAWGWSVVRHGVSVLVGTIVASAVFIAEHFSGVPLSWGVAEWIIGSCVVIAAFLSWREKARALTDSRANVTAIKGELQDARRELDEARAVKRWQFKARVDWVQAYAQRDSVTGETFVWGAVFVAIRNLGEDSLTEDWRIHAKTKDGAGLSVDIFGLGDSTFDVPFANGKTHRYREEHCVNIRARSVVKRGDGVDGILPCRFHGTTNAGDIDAETLRVTFNDVNGSEWMTEAWDGVTTVTEPIYYNPGLPRAE